jgi:hypothetical protein
MVAELEQNCVSWAFSQPAMALTDSELMPTNFYVRSSNKTRIHLRFGYTVEDARTLIEYLNNRQMKEQTC